MGASLGLAVLTKATAYIMLPPFMLWLFLVVPMAFRQRVMTACLALGVAGLVNLGFFVRNAHASGKILACASTLDAEVRQKVKYGGNVAAAKVVGEVVAGRLVERGVKTATFDRGGYLYHGRVRAVADGAREKGLKI